MRLVRVSCIQDERDHVVLPGLHFHGYCGLRCAHSYPENTQTQKDNIRKELLKSTNRVIGGIGTIESLHAEMKNISILHVTQSKLNILVLNENRPLSVELPWVFARF